MREISGGGELANVSTSAKYLYNDSILIPNSVPPTPLLSDRIQLMLLLVMFCVGAPINLAAFTKLVRQRSLGRNGRLNLLKLHLNVTDLMVLFIYVTATACWQITYEWRGGEVLCKVIRFLSSTSFQASSNLIVTVAMDRLFTVLNANRWYKKRFRRRTVWYVRFCLAVAWTSAVIINAPQLYVWRLYSPFPSTQRNWRQCTTIYAMHAHRRRMVSFYNFSNRNASDFLSEATWEPMVSQFTYDLGHVLFVFWIPATLIITCYSFVLIFLYRMEVKRRRALNRGREEYEKDFSDGIDNAATLPLQDGVGKRVSIDSARRRRSSVNNEAVLSSMTVGFPAAIGGVDSRKESQSTNASLHVYLVPVEISRVRNNTFRVSFVLISAYLLFWTPYNALAMWQFVHDFSYRKHADSIKFLNTLIVLNSVVNPFLYGAVKLKKSKYQ